MRALSVSYNKLGNLAVGRGELDLAEEHFYNDLAIAKDLAQRCRTC